MKLFKERLDDIKSSSLETLVNEIDYLKMNILVEISKNAFTAASSNTAKSVVIDNNEEEVVEEKKDVDEKKEEGAITKSITDNTEAIAVIDEVSATTTSSCVSPDNDDETHLASKELDSGVLTPTPFLIKQESGLYSESLPPVFGGENGEIESAINKRSMVALLGGGLSPNNSSDDLLALKKELMPQASIATISAPDQEQQNEQAVKQKSGV